MDQSTSQGWQQHWSPPPPQQTQQQPGAYDHFLSPGQPQAYAFQQSPQPGSSSQTSTPNGIQYGQEFSQFDLYQPQTSNNQQQIETPMVSEDYDQIMAALQEEFPAESPQPAPHPTTQGQSQPVLSPDAYQQYMATLSPNTSKNAYMHLLHPTFPNPTPQQPQPTTSNHVQPQQQYHLPNGQGNQFGQLPQGFAYPFALGNGNDTDWAAFGLQDPTAGDSMLIDPLVLNAQAGPSFSSHPPQQQQPQQQAVQHTISPEMLHPRPQLANPRTIQLPDSLSPQPLMHGQSLSATATPLPSSMPRRASQQAGTSSSQPKVAHTGLEPLLSPEKLDQNPSAVASQLLIQLTGKKTEPPDLETRLKVLRTLREHAPERFWKAWSKEKNAVEMLKGWLDDALSEEKPRAEVLMPLLQVIERIPMTIDTLRSTKIGGSVRRAVKLSPTTAIKDVAQKLETRWRDEVSKLVGPGSKDSDKESTPIGDSAKKRAAIMAEEARKKRKVDQPVASTSKSSGTVTVKKTSTLPTKTVTVNKPSVVVVGKPSASSSTTKAATVDSGFFSSSKPKNKLPSFRKTSAITSADAKKDGDADKPRVAVNNADAFQEALKSLNKKSGIGDKSTPPVEPKPDLPRDSSGTPADPAKLLKKKSVTFAAGDNLRQIKLIEPAVYDDDEFPSEHHNSAKDLDRAEGLALAHAIFDEEIDWYDPDDIAFPTDPPGMPFDRGSNSQEKNTQDAREHSVEEAQYELPESVPLSPQEPASIPPNPDDMSLPHLIMPPNMIDIEPEEDPEAKEVVPNVADLLKRINSGASQAPSITVPQTSTDTSPNTLAGFGIDTARLASILAQAGLAQAGVSTSTPPPQPGGPGSQQGWNGGNDRNQGPNQGGSWGGGYNDGGYGQSDNNGFNRGQSDQGWASRARGKGNRGGGGRGGSGRRRIPCQFYQQGRCRNGDDCDFLHVDA